jgi:hypothetical protein
MGQGAMQGAEGWIYLDKLHLLHLLDGNRTLLDDLGGDGLGGDGLGILVRGDRRESLLYDLSRSMSGELNGVSGQGESTCIRPQAWWMSITPGGGDEGVVTPGGGGQEVSWRG